MAIIAFLVIAIGIFFMIKKERYGKYLSLVGCLLLINPLIHLFLHSSEAGLRGSALVKKGTAGYKANEYYCQKVNWDGYSRRSYVKFKFVK